MQRLGAAAQTLNPRRDTTFNQEIEMEMVLVMLMVATVISVITRQHDKKLYLARARRDKSEPQGRRKHRN